MARGARTRVEAGIYRDASGLAAVINVRGRQKEKRFAPDRDLLDLRIWRSEQTTELLKTTPRLIGDRRILARDIARFLRTRTGRPGYRADRSHAKAWITAFGSRERHEIAREEVARTIAGWTTISPRTMRHRVRVLRELYELLDPGWPHPAIKPKLPKVPKTLPVPVGHDVITAVGRSLAAGLTQRQACGPKRTATTIRRAAPTKTFARYLVYASCGQRPAQIGRAEPGDIDLRRRIWFVRAAKGGDPIPLPLNDEMIAAWQVFAAADAWGVFDTRGFAQTLRRHGWPKGVRPYKLRHTFAIDLLLAGVPLETIQGLLGHVDIRTTRIYAPVLLALMQSAVEKRTLGLSNSTIARDSTHRKETT